MAPETGSLNSCGWSLWADEVGRVGALLVALLVVAVVAVKLQVLVMLGELVV